MSSESFSFALIALFFMPSAMNYQRKPDWPCRRTIGYYWENPGAICPGTKIALCADGESNLFSEYQVPTLVFSVPRDHAGGCSLTISFKLASCDASSQFFDDRALFSVAIRSPNRNSASLFRNSSSTATSTPCPFSRSASSSCRPVVQIRLWVFFVSPTPRPFPGHQEFEGCGPIAALDHFGSFFILKGNALLFQKPLRARPGHKTGGCPAHRLPERFPRFHPAPCPVHRFQYDRQEMRTPSNR